MRTNKHYNKQNVETMRFFVWLSLIMFSFNGRMLGQTWYELTDRFVDSFQIGNYQKAEILARKSLEQARLEFGANHVNYSTSLYNLSRIYKELGKYKDAEPLLVQSIKIKKKKLGALHADYITALNSLGLLYKETGLYYQAEPILDTVLFLNKKTLGDRHLHTAISIDNLAGLLLAIGDYEKAKPLFEEAIETKRNAVGVGHQSYASSLNNLAMLYLELSMYDKAEPVFLQAISIYKKVYGKNHLGYATVINNLGLLYSGLGNYNKASQSFLFSLNIKRSVLGEEHTSYATTLNNPALVYERRRLYKDADSLLNIALVIKRATFGEEHPEYATSLDVLASLYLEQSKYIDAEILAKKALDIRKKMLGDWHPEYASSLNHLAMIYHKTGEFRKAVDLYRNALEIRQKVLGKNHSSFTSSLTNMASIYISLKDYEKAESFFQKANESILDQINRYFPALSEKERNLFLSTIDFHFEVFNSFAISRSLTKPEILGEVFNFQLLIKSLLLNSTNNVRNAILSSNDKVLIDSFKRWISVKERVAKAYILGEEAISYQNIKISELETDANKLEKSLSFKSKTFAKNNNILIYTWHDIQMRLRNKEAAIEVVRFRRYDFQWTDSISYAFLIVTPETKGNPTLVLMHNGNALDDTCLSLYNISIRQQQFSRDFGPSKKEVISEREINSLYTNYWQQIKAAIGEVVKVYFSPDGVYHMINVNALKNPKDGRYVFDETDVRLVISTKDLIPDVTSGTGSDHNAVLLGYPKFRMTEAERVSQLGKMVLSGVEKEKEHIPLTSVVKSDRKQFTIPDLGGTKMEIDNSKSLLSEYKWEAKAFTGNEALEEVVKAVQRPGVLHIATHGYYIAELAQPKEITQTKRFTDNPLLYAGLLLAGAEITLNREKSDSISYGIQDGILSAYEAENLDLINTKLVILSACETGLGDLIRNGEGAYSLQRAFRTAGARAVLYSMWKVDDAATQELMNLFYTNWLATGDKRSALRGAQTSLRKLYPDPFYWGAFMLLGE